MSVPESVEAARAELDQLNGWWQDFVQRQQQAPSVQQRAQYLEGFLAGRAHDPETNGNGKVSELSTPNRRKR
jgi:hypothetical protein